MKTYSYIVDSVESGKRLDVYLLEKIGDISRRKIRAMIDAGGVYINKKRVRIASRAVTVGDSVRAEYNEVALTKLKTESFSFSENDIFLDDFGIFAVNKPPGLPSQATRDQSIMHVIPVLEKFLRQSQRKFKQLILVHRLDKETSGLLLIADGAPRATWLTDQFRERTIKKTYYAVCYGIPSWKTHAEKSPLSEIEKKTGMVRAVRSGGKSALTNFKVLATNTALHLSLIECSPETGRSHQIRVHLELNGYPIVGDKRYGSQGSRSNLPHELASLTGYHHFLHAQKLDFQPGPGLDRIRLEAPMPVNMATFVQSVFPEY